MLELPLYINVSFVITTLLTLYFFVSATSFKKTTIAVSLVWLVMQGIIAMSGFYTQTDVMPPRFLLLVIPPLATIILFFLLRRGKTFTDSFSIRALLLLHIVRVPVEIVLHWLAIEGKVPELMTFEGRNFDIFSGISAALLYTLLLKGKLSKSILLAWNFVCLALLLNIVALAVLSAPFPFQKLAFDQPNVAVLFLPFIWLPCFIVPVVLFSHLLMIRMLLSQKKQDAISRIL